LAGHLYGAFERCHRADATRRTIRISWLNMEKSNLFTMMPGSSIANEDDIDGSDLAMISGGGSILFCGLAIAVTCTVIQTGSR
jgi:hypothetical protein